MTRALINIPDELNSVLLAHGFVDDFHEFVTGDLWTSIEDDSGASTSLQDAVGGELDLITGATDNNEVYVHTTAEVLLYDASKPFWVVSRLQYAEANTDDANVLFGVMEAVAADHLQDDSGGPAADYDGAVFFKVDGETVWNFETSAGTSQTTTASEETAGGSSYHTLGILALPVRSDKIEVIPYIDTAGGNNLKQLRDSNGDPIKHSVDPTSLSEMAIVFGVKAGSANSETLTVDLAGYSMKR